MPSMPSLAEIETSFPPGIGAARIVDVGRLRVRESIQHLTACAIAVLLARACRSLLVALGKRRLALSALWRSRCPDAGITVLRLHRQLDQHAHLVRGHLVLATANLWG